jgi:glutamate racemase
MEQLSSEEVRETHNVYPARDAERSQHAFDTERIEAAGKTEAPIGVFDSGVGGLTVLSALRQELPHENYVYFGDTAHCPYCMRSDAEIIELSSRGSQFLIEQGAKLIILACNTASQAALTTLRATFSIPFVGVVPVVKPAARATKKGRIGIAATNQASKALYLRQLIDEFAEGIEVFAVGCPELVALVEHGELDGPVAEEVVRAALEPILKEDIDVIVLGCTRFPALRPVIERITNKRVQVIDSGAAIARRCRSVLETEALIRPVQPVDAGTGELKVWCSGDPRTFSTVAGKILGYPVIAYQTITKILL